MIPGEIFTSFAEFQGNFSVQQCCIESFPLPQIMMFLDESVKNLLDTVLWIHQFPLWSTCEFDFTRFTKEHPMRKFHFII